MAVVLEAYVKIYLRLLVIAALAGLFLIRMDDVRPCGRQNSPFRQVEIHIAFQKNGVDMECSFWNHYGAAFHGGCLNGAVDGFCIQGRRGVFPGAEIGDEKALVLDQVPRADRGARSLWYCLG